MEKGKLINTVRLKRMKREGIPISVVTAYDYPSARLAEEAGVDVILVGDSLGNVVLGYESTLPVTLDDMIYHTKAVTRAVSHTFVVADMPFMTYHGSIDHSLQNAARLMREGLCKAIKMEGGREIAAAVEACVHAGVPVVGHIGLTPQSVYRIGGYRVQGKRAEHRSRLLEDAKALEEAGACAIVLELMTNEAAEEITRQISIPTIGIGAGAGCDGQVLVFHDLLNYDGVANEKKFVKTYAHIGDSIRQGISEYVRDVKERKFPDAAHSFQGEQEMAGHVYGSGDQ